MAIDGYDVCGAKLEPADARDEHCGLPAGHEGDHYYESAGIRTWFPDVVAEALDKAVRAAEEGPDQAVTVSLEFLRTCRDTLAERINAEIPDDEPEGAGGEREESDAEATDTEDEEENTLDVGAAERLTQLEEAKGV